MARIGLLFAIISLFAVMAVGQTTPTRIRSVTTLPTTCQPGDGIRPTDFVTLISGGKSVQYRCDSTNHFIAMFDISGTTWNFDPTNGILTISGSGTSALYIGQDAFCNWQGPAGNYMQLCNLNGALTVNVNNGTTFNLAVLDGNGDLPAVNANPAPESCGTTATCSATALASATLIRGQVTLSAGTATVTGFSPSYSSTSSFLCLANDITTPANGAKAVPASATSITVTGTGTDVINYLCFGN